MQNDSFRRRENAAPRIWTVSEINRLVRELLEQSLMPFWLTGEISNLTVHRSGHVYFTLKDEKGQISAVFFRGAETARQLKLRNGLDIEVCGRLSVYEPRGTYQVIVDRVKAQGLGMLQQRFEELKAKLRAEGLFDEDRKRKIPALPRCVGVVTSPDGAAIQDFLHILNRRFSNMHVRIVPAAVQGSSAAAQIAKGIDFLNRNNSCDVIILTRGGGSLEDLWAFNEEIVARAVAASTIPVISAVGHEVDFTIADFAADLRVPTPSAAAELVIARKTELLDRINGMSERLCALLQLQLAAVRRRFELAAGSPVFREPRNLVRMYAQRVDDLSMRLMRAAMRQQEQQRARFLQQKAKLEALSPQNVLNRGYAILLSHKTRKALRTAADTAPGERLHGLLAQGTVEVVVEKTQQKTKAAQHYKD